MEGEIGFSLNLSFRFKFRQSKILSKHNAISNSRHRM